MRNTQHQIYQSILLRAADEWGVVYEDVERDIGQQFDPIVRFMAGACASELEQVYQQLHNVEGRIQQRLARILLPEYMHLPRPAHALATASPQDRLTTMDETTAFVWEDQEGGEVAFAPIWTMQLLPAQVKAMATEARLLKLEQRLRRPSANAHPEGFSRIAIGLELPDHINNWQNVSLYFNLKTSSTSERSHFLTALNSSRCTFNGQDLGAFSGLPRENLLLEDYLNGNERLQSQVRARYEHHFLTFTQCEMSPKPPKLPAEFMQKWWALPSDDPETVDERLSPMGAAASKPLHWLEIHLTQPVSVPNLDTCLDIRFNVFPVVNRRLNGAGNGEHHYLQNTTIKWLHLQPTEPFASIRRVYAEQATEHPVFQFKPFADFKESQQASYTLRHGGVGRWDEFNAWQRLAYVVSILQENYQHQELIQQAAASLSLEDIHHLLGKKISETAHQKHPTQDIYVLLHTGARAGVRARVEYWTSQGAAANDIPAKSALRCTSKLASQFDKTSIALVTPVSDGRDPLNLTQQMDAMKSALLSRGRIVTREDVKAFCRQFLGEKIAELTVKDGVERDPRPNFGMIRLLTVQVRPSPNAAQENWEGICTQLQSLLMQKSASSIPIRVRLATKTI
ncbi:hypothetical protein [Phaeodactylibacter xiamenensis]|mgnify:CR=1 FL=1|uniref:hypothetical protein n=1 Tax=Phaeodactylibacter xiamenensis TaxID=1524460 RepID=UPI0024A80DD6|nr:hypothetical protein [Phaeodactylibacter xiamenensis]